MRCKAFAALFAAVVALAGCTNGPIESPVLPSEDSPTNCQLTAWPGACTLVASENPTESQTEQDIAINPTDPDNIFVASKDIDVVASPQGCVWSIGQASFDGGKNWTTTYVGGTAAQRSDQAHPMFGWTCVTDPIVLFDSSGTLYYFLQTTGTTLGVDQTTEPTKCFPTPVPLPGCRSAFFLATSLDGGATFPTDRIIDITGASGAVVLHDYPRAVVNPSTGSVTAAWQSVGAGTTVATTRDGGLTVETIVVPGFRFASGLTADIDGTVWMIVQEGINSETVDTRPRMLAASTDDARSFDLQQLDLTMVPADCHNAGDGVASRCGKMEAELIALTAGPHAGRLLIAWPDGRNSPGDPSDVLVATSDDGGTSWSQPVPVKGGQSAGIQWMPRVATDSNGTVHLVMLDRAYDTEHIRFAATYAWSKDGGGLWENRRVLAGLHDDDIGIHQDGTPFIGDYIGISAAGGRVAMGFPSTETGIARNTVAIVDL